MDIFKLHKEIITNYRDYLQSFTSITDLRILHKVEEAFGHKGFIPEPLIQFNPAYAKGKRLIDLADDGRIHSDLPIIFGSYELYQHQYDAVSLGIDGKGFIVTSGTGSGKSLTFLATIFNHILQQENKPSGIKAILVYPMNALINSQEEEIRKYHLEYLLKKTGEPNRIYYKETLAQKEAIEELERKYKIKFPITYAKYTGQEKSDARDSVKEQKPDIILTNYMMLELIMTRQTESWLRESMADHLRFLAFDELHTYRGRQGADVSFLVRRIKQLVKNKITLIGTSATMITDGGAEERQQAVANVAKELFSEPFETSQIIEEKLTTTTSFEGHNPNGDAILTTPISFDGDAETFKRHPLAIWLENKIALVTEEGNFRRGYPLSLPEIAQKLSEYVDKDRDHCLKLITKLLNWAEDINKREKTKSVLPFKIHQFISQTSTVYVTLDDKADRQIAIEAGRFVKGDDNQDRLLYPVLFSRISGYEFICVELDFESKILKPRDPDDIPEQWTLEKARGKNLTETDFKSGYLVMQNQDEEPLWSEERIESLPDSWIEIKKNRLKLKSFYEFQMPRRIYFNSEGQFSFEPDFPMWAWYQPAKLRVDITAGVVYEDNKTNENTKLMRLGNEGRSTATTIMALSVIKALHEQGETPNLQKLLSFTDNRQDASLQAGHFNDFISTIRLRSALYHALTKNQIGLRIHDIAERMVSELKLREGEYAREPNDDWPDEENERALKSYILIRILGDLKRGWRYNMPNLEGCGLLRIEYEKLHDFVKQDQFFAEIPLLQNMDESERLAILSNILDYFRTSYALYHPRIAEQRAETQNFMESRLDPEKLWSLEKNERIDVGYHLVDKNPGQTRNHIYTASLGPRSNIGRYLKRLFTSQGLELPTGDEYIGYINALCGLLRKGNFLKHEPIRGSNGEVNGYQLRADKIIWKLGDGKTNPGDVIRLSNYADVEFKPNEFFHQLYQIDFSQYQKPIVGREHTGQLSSDDRIEREDQFRKGEISALFCSPTMELGVDISELNIVHMRNVPPNPANYAQRSGRAGRSGQAALVFAYCSSGSPHDRHYFKNKIDMVSGRVVPPRIDLTNEELIRTHLNAFILKELNLDSLRTSIVELIDLTKSPDLPLKIDIANTIQSLVDDQHHNWVEGFKQVIFDIEPKLNLIYWYNHTWLDRQAQSFYTNFDKAFDRWRTLYRNALELKQRAQLITDDPTIKYNSEEAKEARRQRSVAEKQLALLRNETDSSFGNESEFYVFRYLASEGFLPGYNFTRLPVRVFLGYKHQDQGEYISRARNLALREYGPMNLIYHNGNKFRINRMMLVDADSRLRTLKISKKTGYAVLDQAAENLKNDPITLAELKSGDHVELIKQILEISESEGVPTQRISCEEEERMSRGFQIDHYFNYPNGIDSTKRSVIKSGNQALLQLIYGPATEMIDLNRRWNRSPEPRFLIDNRSGRWLRQRDLQNEEISSNSSEVMLIARNTVDTLYIQPMKDLEVDANQIISLSYALKRGIERLFQVEESEIGVMTLGDPESPNLMIYESAEGSLGILSQLVQHPAQMKRLFEEAYSAMHFDPETRLDLRPDMPRATYDDLLSYYNQPHHDRLDRHSIKIPLERLMSYNVELVQGQKDRQQQYQHLLENYDKNSGTELKLIQYLYEKGYALPDKAQVNMEDYYISADFVYNLESGPVIIFCDGSVHDQAQVKADDQHKRGLLRLAGFDVIEWHYSEPVEELVNRRKDVFRKIS